MCAMNRAKAIGAIAFASFPVIFFISIFFSIIAASAFADEVLRAEIVLSRNDSAVLRDIRATIGTADWQNNFVQDYSIEVFEEVILYKSYLPVDFVTYT